MKIVLKNEWKKILFVIFFYLLILFFFKKDIFYFRFDKNLVQRYFLSQDITHEVPGKRLFLSDGDIYSASGYLYATGSDPTEYDFQQPPLIKYLFGFSSIFFGNPFIVQIIFGIAILITLYFLAIKIYKSSLVPLLACLLLVIDPVFIDVTSQPLLDLGQSAFLLLYVFLILYFDKKYWLHGIVLGLMAASKFWAAPLFFVFILSLYKMAKKQFNLRKFLLHLSIAFVVFSLTYTKTFINKQFAFNIIFFQLKIMKFMLAHDAHSIPLASFLLFLTGYVKTWWGNHEIIRDNTWSLFWPISFMTSGTAVLKMIRKKIINERLFIAIIPIFYLFYLGFQAPFPRYFIIILPFSYLVLANYLILTFRKILPYN